MMALNGVILKKVVKAEVAVAVVAKKGLVTEAV